MSRDAPRCWAVVPAAGSGSRMGTQLPKQYLELAGATVLEHSLRALLGCAQVAGAVVALPAGDRRAAALPLMRACDNIRLVTGGAQRSASVRQTRRRRTAGWRLSSRTMPPITRA